MNVIAAIAAVFAIGWAAAHPGGMVATPSPVDPANCTVTSKSDGPVDPVFEARLRAATEQLCKTLDQEGA